MHLNLVLKVKEVPICIIGRIDFNYFDIDQLYRGKVFNGNLKEIQSDIINNSGENTW